MFTLIRDTIAFAVIFAILLLFAFRAVGKPDKSEPPKKQPPVPQLINACQFGDIKQTGKTFTISGNESWAGQGTINGKRATIEWVRFPTARLAIGIYVIGDDGQMRGHWRWADEAEYDLEGNLKDGNGEHLYPPSE